MTTPPDSTDRQWYQDRMQQLRSNYAVSEADSGGRSSEEAEHPYRTCFQRDRDRIVHCSAFRRLDFKTQVFVPHEHDHFRTRLTHSLEVAQIGRDIGRALGLNEDLIEAVALAHDIGHSPFGHGGEKVLDELMADHGGFEHNRQSLRVVDYVEHPYPDFRGLNLTNVVRECLAKHETKYDVPSSEGFEIAGSAPLEGQVVDIADEIAYTAADLDDALAAGLLGADQLSSLDLWARAWSLADKEYPDASPVHKRIRATKALLAIMADDLIGTTTGAIRRRSIASLADVRAAGERIAGFSGDVRSAVDQMQGFLLEMVYEAGENARQTELSRQIICELFEAYLADPSKLPKRYARRIDTAPDLTAHRVICDFIAGMTDRYCRQQHQLICRD